MKTFDDLWIAVVHTCKKKKKNKFLQDYSCYLVWVWPRGTNYTLYHVFDVPEFHFWQVKWNIMYCPNLTLTDLASPNANSPASRLECPAYVVLLTVKIEIRMTVKIYKLWLVYWWVTVNVSITLVYLTMNGCLAPAWSVGKSFYPIRG